MAKAKKEKFVKISIEGTGVRFNSEGLSLVEMLGMLRLYEQQISITMLNNLKSASVK